MGAGARAAEALGLPTDGTRARPAAPGATRARGGYQQECPRHGPGRCPGRRCRRPGRERRRRCAQATCGRDDWRGSKASARKGPDRLELDPTDITGNRELPKVLYIVPWKRSDLGDLLGKPVNSLVDEVLQPLDRDVFQRENRYYDALKPERARPGAGAVQGPGEQR